MYFSIHTHPISAGEFTIGMHVRPVLALFKAQDQNNREKSKNSNSNSNKSIFEQIKKNTPGKRESKREREKTKWKKKQHTRKND